MWTGHLLEHEWTTIGFTVWYNDCHNQKLTQMYKRIGTHPLLPIHLLIYATQTSITTLTCIAEYLSWTHLTVSDKINLGYLYVPYLALCKKNRPFPFPETVYSFPVVFFRRAKRLEGYEIVDRKSADIHDKAVFMGVDMFARLQDRLMPV